MNDLIELRGLCKHYPNGSDTIHALRELELTVASGEFTALCGPSGSGKSTLLNICGLLDLPSAGTYRLLGEPVAALNPRQRTRLRRERIGFVFQGFNLVPVMSAFENVEYPLLLQAVPAAERRRRVERILEQVGLARHAGQRPDRLSGGQRQRVAIARALVKRPALVIADEPTASLDSTTANQVIDLMQALAASDGASFLIATHDDRMTARCTRVLRLEDGRIAEQEVRHAVA